MPEHIQDENSSSRRSFLINAGKSAAAAATVPFLLGGVRRPASECYEGDQYKRRGLNAMVKITDGDHDAAISCLHRHLDAYPNDPEFYYGLAVAHTQKRDWKSALEYVGRAVENGLPPERFLAGPRNLLAPLTRRSAFQQLIPAHTPILVHGPLLGHVTDQGAQVWVRTYGQNSVQIAVEAKDGSCFRSDSVRTSRDMDYTGVATVTGLQPNTFYTYRLILDGEERQQEEWCFRTCPSVGQSARFEVGFGGCAGYTPWHERIWGLIADYDFPAFLLTGDNVYTNTQDMEVIRPDVQRYCYYRRQSHPAFRRFVASTAIYAIWDDHDFATNDSWGGPHRYEPAWKIDVWHNFVNNWNNPYYGGGTPLPGCWFDFSIADVDFFMLDGRYYRTAPTEEYRTMLGPDQKAWLFERLLESEAAFKVLVTSVPWAYGVKPGSSDPWQGYKEERDEIFSFLHEHRIEGVLLLCGDRHRADVWRIERSEGYDLYDLENARLTNVHTHKKLDGALKSYNDKCTFGRLRFDTTGDDPVVHYEVITLDDEVAYDFTLRRSQLSYG